MPEELDNSVAPDTRSSEELDKLADSSDVARNSERPMTTEPEKEAPTASPDGFEFVHNGKPVKASREQILKWAQQGYDYPQKAQKLNQERVKWQEDRTNWEKQWGVYKQIDDFARQNKDWWNFIQEQWQGRANFQPGQNPGAAVPANDPYASKFQTLEQKLSQFEPLLAQIVEDRTVAKEREEDQKLDSEIQSIRAQHPDLDWQSLDENGKSLELQILEHAQATGIPTFRAAMRDLLHEDLLAKAQATAKIAVSKGIQQKTKLGVLGESPTPRKAMPQRTKDIRNTSYEEIMDEIRSELAQGRA